MNRRKAPMAFGKQAACRGLWGLWGEHLHSPANIWSPGADTGISHLRPRRQLHWRRRRVISWNQMRITVQLPEDIAQHSNPGREALEALAVEGYRSGKLT